MARVSALSTVFLHLLHSIGIRRGTILAENTAHIKTCVTPLRKQNLYSEK